jgi:two-component system sensor histidine kinase KdpD
MGRGQLRIYLGAAPGVGKTYAMLSEGRRRAGRGTDVVVGYVETYDRPRTAELLEGMEVLPRATVSHRGATFTELDTDAVIARRPQVALIDELAHTNVPGSSDAKRWQDVERILDAGITVLSTVNIQHLDSVNDVVREITGVPQRETVPDEVVRRADQVELVDITPEALRRRMAHGNIYPPDRADAALANYFRTGNLTALRELALLWVADKVDDQLERYRAEHGITGTWETHERVVVALTGGPEGDTLIRRASRIAERVRGADLLAVHVSRSEGLTDAAPAHLALQRALVENLGGTYHQVVGEDVPSALLDFARAVNATQLVLGASRRGRLGQLVSRGVGVTTSARSGPIDVHLVTHEHAGRGRGAGTSREGITRRRRLAGFLLAAAAPPLTVVLLTRLRGRLSLSSDILVLLAVVVAVALVGGRYPALGAAVFAFLLLDYYFTEPVHSWRIGDADQVIALAAFVLIAATVSTVVDLAARRTLDAARARADAETLSTLAGSVLRGDKALDALLERLRESFGLTSVTLLEHLPGAPLTPNRQHDPGSWRIAAYAGVDSCGTPDEGDAGIPVGEDLTLVLRGRPLAAADQRILEAFAAQAAVALRQQRLQEDAEKARPIAEADRARTARLDDIAHALRASLTHAEAVVDALADPDRASTTDHAELLAAARDSLARLDTSVADLEQVGRG